MPKRSQPIGMFDSGLGGLSVYREIRTRLPHEDVIYYADSAWCPYGTRSHEEIRQRCHAISQLLIEQGAKVIVVACNTATSVAIDFLRASFPQVPFIGLEPAVKPAAAMTASGKVGVLATPRTVTGNRLRWLIETHASGVEVRTTPGNGLVELVESGTLRGPEVVRTIQPMLEPMLDAGVDVIVLGCTHYPFLHVEMKAFAGEGVAIIDSGAAIARRAANLLRANRMLNGRESVGNLDVLTSAPAEEASRVGSLLLETPVAATQVECASQPEPSEPAKLCELDMGFHPAGGMGQGIIAG